MRSAFPLAVSIFLAASCGGHGGGASSSAVTLSSAAFVGAGPPAAGNTLVLVFDGDVTLRSGMLLDDGDVTLSSGTLGSVTAAPTQVNARSIRLVLGAGVSFTPGSTTIMMSAGNDVVQNTSGQLAAAGTPHVITAGDGDVPAISSFTLNAIDGVLNGSGAAGGVLEVPQNGFTIDLAYADPTSAIDVAALVLTANVTVTAGGQPRAPGTNLVGDLSGTAGPNSVSWSVPASVVFPESPVTLTAWVSDVTGMVSNPATFVFTVRQMNDAIRPFETSVNASQVWFLNVARDVESYTVNLGSAFNPVQVQNGASGKPDLFELFEVLGMHGSVSATNDLVTNLFEQRILTEMTTIYAGVNVTFTFTSPGTFPTGQTSVPYASFGFSQICIAGSEDTTGLSGVLGVAIFDKNNANQNDDCVTDFAGSQRLGVFLHTAVNDGMRQSSSSTFRQTYDALTPARGGTAIGGDAQDDGRLQGLVADARATTIHNAINRMARMAAIIAAHECGHSVGLVMDGAPPVGLHGGNSVAFPGSTSGHIKMPASVFTGGSQNIMSPAINFDAALLPGTAFDTLNMAYLRERALYN